MPLSVPRRWIPLSRILLVLMATLLELSCSSGTPNLAPAARLTFVRAGLVVENATGPVLIDEQGARVSTRRVGLSDKRQLLTLDWHPGRTYEVTVGGRRQTLVAPQKPTPLLLHTLELPALTPAADPLTLPDTTVHFSPDSRFLAIGTLTGSLQVVDVLTGTVRWQKQVAEGMIKRLAFSPDGRTLYAGEQSPDGNLVAFDATSGDRLWQFRLADDLGTSPPPPPDDRYAIYFLPGVYQLEVTQDGEVLVAGTHSWSQNGAQHNRSRLYVFSPRGQLLWQYPDKAPLDAVLVAMDADPAGRSLLAAVSRSATTPPQGPITRPSVLALDLKKRQTRWTYPLEVLPPFKEVFVWNAVAITPDARRGIVGLGDGRGLLFDLEPAAGAAPLLHTVEAGTPLEVSGLPIASPVSYAAAGQGTLYLQTNDTNIPVGTSATSKALPAPHPGARALMALELDGRMRWQLRGDFTPSGIWLSSDEKALLMTTANPSHEARRDLHGLVLLDPQAEDASQRVIYTWKTEGPVFFHADISPDGFALAITECPSRKPDGSVYGRWRVHLIH